METEKPIIREQEEFDERGDLGGKISTAGWALFFVWIGIALLMNIDFGITLLGIGLITLGGQAARKYFNLELEGFSVVVGLFFLLGSLWGLDGMNLPLMPLLLIAVGLMLLFSITRGKRNIADYWSSWLTNEGEEPPRENE